MDVPNDEMQAKALFESFNKKDYKAGKAHFNEAEHALPLVDDIENDMGDIDIAASVAPVVDSGILRCEKQADKTLWGRLSNFIDPGKCDFEALKQEGAIIKAQHSMAHMVETLQQSQYAHLAHEAVYR